MPLKKEKERKELIKVRKAQAKVLGSTREITNQKVKESQHGLIRRGHNSIQKLGKVVIQEIGKAAIQRLGTAVIGIIGTQEPGQEIKVHRKEKALGNQRQAKEKACPAWT